MRNEELDSNDPKAFEVIVGAYAAQVSVHKIKSRKVFHLVYPSGRPALNVTVAANDDGKKFWTSISEGRQEEAELAGKVIAAYLRVYRRTLTCVTTTGKKSATPNLFD